MEKIKVSLVEQALKIAVEAHAGQVRKNDGSPYIVHPVMVARIVEQAGFSEEVVAAALVHDVLEDTSVTEAELRALLGDEITNIVLSLSEDKSLPWEERKQQYIECVVMSGESVMVISLADKIHNAENLLMTASITGATVWKVFNRGKAEKLWFEESLYTGFLSHFKHPLLARYRELIDEMTKIPE